MTGTYPLAGLKVVELARILAGPWAGQVLADLGAEVIKVESPEGDDTRTWGPPFLDEPDGTRTAGYYHACNRGKRAVVADFTTPEGQQIVRDLVADADVLIENFKVGGLAKYGLDYAALSALNPRLVYCSITGFGQDGPYAHRPGYDYIIQGMSGFMSVTGRPEGEPGGGPMRAGVAVVDLFTGMYTANAILAALVRRGVNGEGAHIDSALFDVSLAVLANQASNYLASGREPGRQGVGHPNLVPYQPFETADRPLIIAVGNDRQFARLAELLDAPEWASDSRFATNPARVSNRDLLIPLIEERLRERPALDWSAQLDAAGIPAGPINGIGQALTDPQALHRGMTRELGGYQLPGSPLRLDGERIESDMPPPRLGQHTDDVLAELGASSAEIHHWRLAGVVG